MIEWLTVACTAVLMSRLGYMFLSRVTDMDWSDWKDTKWVLWSCLVSAVTWSVLWLFSYRFTRSRSLLPWLVIGAVSPLLGCIVFFPATPWALAALAEHFYYIVPFGVGTGVVMCGAVIALRWLTTSSIRRFPQP